MERTGQDGQEAELRGCVDLDEPTPSLLPVGGVHRQGEGNVADGHLCSNLPCQSDLMAGYLPLLVIPRHDTHRAVIVTGLRLIRGDGLASGAG